MIKRVGRSWTRLHTKEHTPTPQHLERAINTLSSLGLSVFMGDSDDRAVQLAKATLRGSW